MSSTSRRHNTPQYICTQSGSTKIYKATTNRTKGRNQQKHNHAWNLNIPLTAIDRSPKHKINK